MTFSKSRLYYYISKHQPKKNDNILCKVYSICEIVMNKCNCIALEQEQGCAVTFLSRLNDINALHYIYISYVGGKSNWTNGMERWMQTDRVVLSWVVMKLLLPGYQNIYIYNNQTGERSGDSAQLTYTQNPSKRKPSPTPLSTSHIYSIAHTPQINTKHTILLMALRCDWGIFFKTNNMHNVFFYIFAQDFKFAYVWY